MKKIKIMIILIVFLIIIISGAALCSEIFTDVIEPVCQADIAINVVNGGDVEFIQQNIFQHHKDSIRNIGGCIFILGIISMLYIICPKRHEEKDELKV